jgi:tetratricopeptide (TPR) repeat protein
MIRLLVLLMFASCFTLATILQPQFEQLRLRNTADAGVMEELLGDSRRLFANHFFTMADAYFHSGFYPGIFDAPRLEEESPLTSEHNEHEEEHHHHHHETSTFLLPPVDWIERFGRHFIPNQHTHLEGANSREFLPWLRLSADMDPRRVQTYLTASYWLRAEMNRPTEAEAFLREGLRANPDSYEILFELGKVYNDNKKDPRTARNIFSLAVRKWERQEAAGLKPDPPTHVEILGEMVRVDEEQNDLNNWLADLQALEKVTANPKAVQTSIEQVKAKLGAAANARGK